MNLLPGLGDARFMRNDRNQARSCSAQHNIESMRLILLKSSQIIQVYVTYY